MSRLLEHAVLAICLAVFVAESCEGKYVWQTGNVSQHGKSYSVLPGTKWCGQGNNARNFSDLGKHNETDRCCRDHDHCRNTIAPFRRRYGVFNFSPLLMFECSCQNQFYDCLWRIHDQDPMAIVVGKLYFDWVKVLQVKCFKLVEVRGCSKKTFDWWKMKFICVEYITKVVGKTMKMKRFSKFYRSD